MTNNHLKISICIFLTIATLSVFWQVQDHDFVNFDDNLYILDNQHVQAGLTRESMSWAFTTLHGGFWFPMTWLSHMADYEFYGLNPKGHHFNNLLLHIANTLLLFLVLYRVTGAIWQSAFVAMLFALHPLHVEPVAWVSSRKDVLSTLFWMLTMWAYTYYTERPGVKRYLLVLLMFILGLMSKPMLVTLPFILLLLDYWPIGRLQPRQLHVNLSPRASPSLNNSHKLVNLFVLILEKLPFLIFSIISSFLVFFAEQNVGALPSLESYPLNIRLANALVSYASYILKMFWPLHLAVYYPHPSMPPWWQVTGAGLLLAFIFFFVIKSYRTYPHFLVGWLWYLGSLVPVIGLVQIGAHAMADRYTYIPLIGLFIMISWGIPYFLKEWHFQRLVLKISGVLLILALIACSWAQVRHWKSGITLFKHALNVTSNNHLMHYNMGYELSQKGIYDDAILHFSEAIRIRPDYVEARNNAGVILAEQGRLNEAITHFIEVLKVKPDNVEAYNNLAFALAEKGDLDDAILNLLKAEKIQSDHAETYYNLGLLFTKQGKFDAAVSHFLEAIRIRPDYAEAYNNMGFAFAKQGNLDKAVSYLFKAIRIQPDYAEAHYNLGIILTRQGKFNEAIEHYREALRFKSDYMEARHNLQVTLKKLGR